MISPKQHSRLKGVCKNWSDYMDGKMGVDTYGHDCSCGCLFFIELEGSGDWGVCSNVESARAGLLTWEHMGCNNFKKGNL